jgi:hypothetical protein
MVSHGDVEVTIHAGNVVDINVYGDCALVLPPMPGTLTSVRCQV